MAKVNFSDSTTINVVALDGETFTLKAYFLPKDEQQVYADLLVSYFDECFEDDKTSMVYWVLMKMMGHGFSFHYWNSDRNEERERIGARIRQIREEKGMDAKGVAKLANIDAANLCRIEQGRYSVGLDILTKISTVLGVKVDLI
jgi:DNA-binding XRE family transcriptional regulator